MRERGCTRSAPAAGEMSGSGNAETCVQTLMYGGGDMEDDIAIDRREGGKRGEENERMEEKNRKFVRKEGEGREGRDEGGRRERRREAR